MVPSSGSSLSSSTAAAAEGPSESSFPVATTPFQRHPQEPNLYSIPPPLSPTYRPLPIVLRILVWTASILSSVAISFRPFLIIAHKDAWNVRTAIGFVAKALLFSLFSKTILQEILVPPSRISTSDLIQKYILPSTLSRFDRLQIDSSNNQTREQGVHYLQYDAPTNIQQQAPPQFQAIYVHHGFGANAMSWLPVLPPLVECLQAKLAVGHDATGFGFTERPPKDPNLSLADNLQPYTPKGSSEIGQALLEKVCDNNVDKPIVLMGHSWGALSALHMASALPKETRKWVILVAPALGVNPPSGRAKSSQKANGRIKEAAIGLGSVVGQYALRRLVGGKNFWRRGLEQVWGDKKKLSDSDVLRFQWPAVGKGWEDGILTFTRAMAQPPLLSDAHLLEQVLEPDANTTVTVIVASEDKVIPSERTQKFLEPYREKLRVIEMEGLGHDPFEEDVDAFVKVVEDVLEKDKEQILGRVN